MIVNDLTISLLNKIIVFDEISLLLDSHPLILKNKLVVMQNSTESKALQRLAEKGYVLKGSMFFSSNEVWHATPKGVKILLNYYKK